MTSRTKKAVAKKTVAKKVAVTTDDTVTFKKSELVDRLKTFLEDQGACEGDWVNKVRVEFLGEKIKTVDVRVHVAADLSFEMATSGIPTRKEMRNYIQAQIDSGDVCLPDHVDESDFEVVEITVP